MTSSFCATIETYEEITKANPIETNVNFNFTKFTCMIILFYQLCKPISSLDIKRSIHKKVTLWHRRAYSLISKTQLIEITRMHSSRMRTVHSSGHISGGVSAPGGVCSGWGVCSWGCALGVSALWGCLLWRGCVSALEGVCFGGGWYPSMH